MKVVIQNGSNHPISRLDAESLIENISGDLQNKVKQVTLYRSESEEIYAYFYNKSKVLGIFSPENGNKEDIINTIYMAFGCLKVTGDIPKKIPKSKKAEYLEQGRHAITGIQNAI